MKGTGLVLAALAVASIGCAPVAFADQASYYLDRVHTYAFGERYDDMNWLAERDKVCAAKGNGAKVTELWNMPKKDLPLLTENDAQMLASLASLSC